MNQSLAVLVFAVAVLASGMSFAQSSQPAPDTPPTPASLRQCVDRVLGAIDHAQVALPEMSLAADAAARRWIDGANLFAGGDLSFSDEAFYRAGGLIGIRRIAPIKQSFLGRQMPWQDVPENSVILYGLLRNADPTMTLFDEVRHLAGEGDTVVFFGSRRWITCQRLEAYLQRRMPKDRFFFIDTDLPTDTSLTTADGLPYGDYAGMATAAHLWTFTAELIAACSRQGKTPGVWPSGTIPRYQVWEKKYEKIKFHDDIRIEPIAAGSLGKEYLRVLRQQVDACRKSGEQIRAAGRLLAAVPRDRAVYAMIESHLLAQEAWLPTALPNWTLVQRGYRWNRATPTMQPGDAVLWLGYLDWPDDEIQQAVRRGSPFVSITVRGPGQQTHDEPLVTPAASSQPFVAIRPDAADDDTLTRMAPATLPAGTLWVRAPWRYPDAAVIVPGYPLPACPTSGIVQGTILWGLVGEVLQNSRSER